MGVGRSPTGDADAHMGLPALSAAAVRLGRAAADKTDAVQQTGDVLVEIGRSTLSMSRPCTSGNGR